MTYQAKNALKLYKSWRNNEYSVPDTVEILVSSRCNSRCIMCNVWRLAKKNLSIVDEELSISEYKNLLDELSSLGTRLLCISGGEPLLKKGVFSIIQKAKEKNLKVELITNGTLISDAIAKRLVESGIDLITFSIDASRADLHDQIRGVPRAWEKATRGITMLNNLRKQADSQKTRLAIGFLVTRINYHLIPEMIDLKPKLGFDDIHFLPVIGKTPAARELYLTIDDLKSLKKNLKTIRAKMKLQNLPTTTLTPLSSICHDMENAAEGRYFVCNTTLPEKIKREILCFAPWTLATIDPFGNVYPCCFACTFQNLSEDLTHSFWGREDFCMGNMKQKSFKEIWYGKRFAMFREKCRDPPTFPMCHYCGYDFSYNVFLTGLVKKRKVFLRYIHKYAHDIIGRIARP
jgi:MoaA/NifB/PqqE/SkfB family radical SAM enzyme